MRNPISVAREKFQTAKEIVVEVYEEDKNFYMFCAGSIATSITTIAIFQALKAKGVRFDYMPSQPIPSLLLSEDQIRRIIGSSTLANEYFKANDLSEDFLEFSRKRLEEVTRILTIGPTAAEDVLKNLP